ncbi:MAG: glutamate formimidoyltransferase [Fidelibacterota bacterium]
MDKIIECVPNFSEGRNKATIDAIGESISSVSGAFLLDMDRGHATNRTVVTFVGSPEGVKEAAFRAIRTASDLIDMRQHSGAHARMGATDVCPFIPVRGVDIDECVTIAREVGERVARELGIPVYLYEYAATSPERKNLANIRKGEYEGLEQKLKDEHWKPDFGEATFNPKSGATVIGVREFLIAYNVNLNTRDMKWASDIALDIREKGRAKRDDEGKIARDDQGRIIRVPGRLKECKAVGWVIEEYGKAQVSINLTNFRVTPVHVAFETVREEARKRGLRVTGSEIVGLVPLEAMLMAGTYYLRQQGKTSAVPEKELVRVAVESMGLEDVAPFDPGQKIVEYRVAQASPLTAMTVVDFAHELSTGSPAPGGGSVSALMGTLGGALVSMVAALTHGKKGMESSQQKMEEIGRKAQDLKDRLVGLVQEDTEAFNAMMAAMRMKRKTEEQKKERHRTVQAATRKAALVPLDVGRACLEVLELSQVVAREGNPSSVSDAGVAADAAYAGLKGARLNVLINLPAIEDDDFCREMREIIDDLESQARDLQVNVARTVQSVIEKM